MILNGAGAWSRLKFESGVHRVQRVPETESGGRVHTSTATVAVLPEMEEVDVDLRPEDIEMQVYRSSGAGGQHINKTSLRRAADPQADGNRRGVSGGALAGAEPREVYADACVQAL